VQRYLPGLRDWPASLPLVSRELINTNLLIFLLSAASTRATFPCTSHATDAEPEWTVHTFVLPKRPKKQRLAGNAAELQQCTETLQGNAISREHLIINSLVIALVPRASNGTDHRVGVSHGCCKRAAGQDIYFALRLSIQAQGQCFVRHVFQAPATHLWSINSLFYIICKVQLEHTLLPL